MKNELTPTTLLGALFRAAVETPDQRRKRKAREDADKIANPSPRPSTHDQGLDDTFNKRVMHAEHGRYLAIRKDSNASDKDVAWADNWIEGWNRGAG